MQKPPESEWRCHDAAWVAAALFFALILRALFFCALTGYDEFAYARIAADIAEGTFRFREVTGYYGFRYLVTLPAAFFYKFLGQNQYSAAAWPLACSLGNVILAYLLGRELFNRRTGVIAAVFQACLPISVVYGTMLYPDEILVFWTGLSALFFLKGAKVSGKWGGAGFLAFSGLLAGLGWYTRLNSAVLLIVYAAWSLRGGPRPAHLALVGGFLCALIPDWAAGFALAGDPLFSLRSQLAKLSSDSGAYAGGHLVYLRSLLGLDLYGLALFGFYFYFAAAAAAVAGYRKELGRLWVPLAWFVIVLIYLEFGPASLSPYQPVHKQLRFLSMGFFPVIISAAFVISEFRLARYRLLCAGFLILTSIVACWKMNAYVSAAAVPQRLAAVYLKARAPAGLYVTGSWGHFLAYYLRDQHSVPYYRKLGDGNEFIQPLERAAAARTLSRSCAVIDALTETSVVGGDARDSALRRIKKDLREVYAVPGGPVIYCFKALNKAAE